SPGPGSLQKSWLARDAPGYCSLFSQELSKRRPSEQHDDLGIDQLDLTQEPMSLADLQCLSLTGGKRKISSSVSSPMRLPAFGCLADAVHAVPQYAPQEPCQKALYAFLLPDRSQLQIFCINI
ncbi:MAG: hypothetical protein ACRERE_07370, partial [Candidatus Entotheonellia bacterium]